MGRTTLALLTLGVLSTCLSRRTANVSHRFYIFCKRKEGREGGKKEEKEKAAPPPNMDLYIAQASFELVTLVFSLLNDGIIGMASK